MMRQRRKEWVGSYSNIHQWAKTKKRMQNNRKTFGRKRNAKGRKTKKELRRH
jgi:hypothetical protein